PRQSGGPSGCPTTVQYRRESRTPADWPDQRQPSNQTETAKRKQGIENILAGKGQRVSADEALKLSKGNKAARKGDRTNEDTEANGYQILSAEQCRISDTGKLAPGNQCRSAAAKAVEDGNHLRHGGHFHLLGCKGTNSRSQHNAANDIFKADNLLIEKCDNNTDEHAQGRQL